MHMQGERHEQQGDGHYGQLHLRIGRGAARKGGACFYSNNNNKNISVIMIIIIYLQKQCAAMLQNICGRYACSASNAASNASQPTLSSHHSLN